MNKLMVLLGVSASLAFGESTVIWSDPGAIEYRDLFGGPAGRGAAPRGPFRLIKTDETGTSPKIIVRDRGGNRWTVKWGPEVKAENFASRMAWAVGYFAEPVYYVSSGRIYGSRRHLGRAEKFIENNGTFHDARFEGPSNSGKFLQHNDWTWENNPFIGTHELQGLKIILMLISNWDNKDARDGASNTGILQSGNGSNGRRTYLVTDWGASMGKWGNFFTREKWDCEGFRAQTPGFVDGVEKGMVKFGFVGKHDDDFKKGIRLSDIRWLMQYLGRVSDTQLKRGLTASGASDHEIDCFTVSIRNRINQLRRVARAGVRGS